MAIRLVIDLDDRGQMRIEGPIHDKILCYGILEAAKIAVKEHQAAPRVVQPIIQGISVPKKVG